jgi:HEAT repeat protein
MCHNGFKRFACNTLIAVLLAVLSGRAAAFEDVFDSLVDDMNNGNKAERMAAISKLSEMKDERSLKALINEFHEPYEDWKIRIKALDALAASGSPMVTDALIDGLNDSCPAIKWNSAMGLGGYNNSRTINALDDSTLFIREAAIESLGKIRALKAVPHLGIAVRDSSFAVRLKATLALGRIGDEQSMSFLEWVAQNEKDLFIREEAVSILKRPASK